MAASSHSAIKSVVRKAGLFYFVWVMFSYCTGGPFGLEDMVTTSGPGMALLYMLVLPFFWCIPVSLVSGALQKKLSEQRDRLKLPDDVGDIHVENGQLVATQK